MENLLDNYQKLNDSYKKTLVFNIGTDAGFFSEYNNMILAMLYCLENKIRFTLFSKNANFAYKEGWNDYFLPFCEENKSRFHAKYNHRYPRYIYKRERLFYFLYRILKYNNFLTFQLWDQMRDRNLENKTYNIPELGINGDLRDACRILIKLTWRFNPNTQERINQLISSLQLPEKYIGFHIRSGDKLSEVKLLAPSIYIEKTKHLSDIRDAFVCTDNYQVIKELENQYAKEWDIYTLCEQGERGYFHVEFQNQTKEVKKESHEKLFASIEVLSRSVLFIGTYSSNPDMFLGMRMPKDKVIGIDLEKWQIW
jgi:hypothetical protein